MGLIATLILGQMAVDIGLFQSEILLYSSISSIGGYATPSYELSLANKLIKLLLILIVGLFGAEGFIVSVTLLIVFLGAIKTYGLPYLYPFIPFDYKEFIKVIFRPNIN
jgi:stage V sporulation protein AF